MPRSGKGAHENQCVAGRSVRAAVVAPSAARFVPAGATVKRDRRQVVGGDLEKGGYCAAPLTFGMKVIQKLSAGSLTARLGRNRESQKLGLVDDNPAQKKALRCMAKEDGGIAQKCREFPGRPGARRSEAARVQGSQFRRVGHGRMTGGGLDDGAASAGRT